MDFSDIFLGAKKSFKFILRVSSIWKLQEWLSFPFLLSRTIIAWKVLSTAYKLNEIIPLLSSTQRKHTRTCSRLSESLHWSRNVTWALISTTEFSKLHRTRDVGGSHPKFRIPEPCRIPSLFSIRTCILSIEHDYNLNKPFL